MAPVMEPMPTITGSLASPSTENPLMSSATASSPNQQLQNRRNAAMPRGVGVMCGFHAVQADNALLTDAEGRQYIDFAAGIAELNTRSEEHTSELQSQSNLVCRLLLEK